MRERTEREKKMIKAKDIICALMINDFDLEHLELTADDNGTIEVETSDKETIEAIVSTLFTEVLDHGVVVERFSGIGSATIILDPTVKYGVIEEMNTHELHRLDPPLDKTPCFFQRSFMPLSAMKTS